MSLVGSLEDLGLADILQIVSLSRKSGVLLLRSEDGEGRIVFREGLVHAAAVKGQTRPAPAAATAASGDRPDALRRAEVERAVAHMFEWRTGEFSFDVRDGLDPADAGPALAVGLSPQYLTMEATRLGDERRAGLAPSGDEDATAATAIGDPWFDGEPDDAGTPREALIDAVLRRVDAEDEVALEPAEVERPGVEVGSGRADPVRAACANAVVMDPDLAALEWLKATFEGLFARVHIFQGAEDGITRIRQYLSRGELPAVVLSDRAPMDPLSGIATASELLRRLRVQAPRMPLLLLVEEGAPAPRASRFADALVWRPTAATLRDPRGAARIAGAADALRARVAPYARPRGT
jgi:hypothetical protein